MACVSVSTVTTIQESSTSMNVGIAAFANCNNLAHNSKSLHCAHSSMDSMNRPTKSAPCAMKYSPLRISPKDATVSLGTIVVRADASAASKDLEVSQVSNDNRRPTPCWVASLGCDIFIENQYSLETFHTILSMMIQYI